MSVHLWELLFEEVISSLKTVTLGGPHDIVWEPDIVFNKDAFECVLVANHETLFQS